MDLFCALKSAVVSTAVMMAVAAGLAWAVHLATGYNTAQLPLAYAPGGLNEMSLLSFAPQADFAFVATHHLLRIIVLLALAERYLPKLPHTETVKRSGSRDVMISASRIYCFVNPSRKVLQARADALSNFVLLNIIVESETLAALLLQPVSG